MGRILMLASVASMIDQFNIPNIELLQKEGYKVDVACNFKKGNTCPTEKIIELRKKLKRMNVHFYQINFSRDITKLRQNLRALRDVISLLKNRKYDFIHCHSPIGGVIGRIAGRLSSTKVIYTAHGFHFYTGAPLKNWLIYYPVEWTCSWMTDLLITINKEDYFRANKYMHAKQTEYIPGIGVDTKKFSRAANHNEIRSHIRMELGLKESDIMMLSVGELSERKNQKVTIEAVARIENTKLHYFICGIGDLQKEYEELISSEGQKHRIHLLGFRTDISDLYIAADLFIFPSLQEGLPLALMEAMASELPIIASEIRGNSDLIQQGNGGFLIEPLDVNEYIVAINKLVNDEKLRKSMAARNVTYIKDYNKDTVNFKMHDIYCNRIK